MSAQACPRSRPAAAAGLALLTAALVPGLAQLTRPAPAPDRAPQPPAPTRRR